MALNVYQSVAKVMEAVGAVRKDRKNTAQNFNFRGVDDVVNAVAPHLREHGVIVAPLNSNPEWREITSGNGKRQAWVTGTVDYAVYGSEGDFFTIQVASEATDFADKATAKFMSVAYRIALLQLLNLPTDDADPDQDYVERGSVTKPTAKAPARSTAKPAAKKVEPKTVDECERLRTDIFAACEKKGISQPELVEAWKTVGGTGKITACTDDSKLAALLTHITMNEEG